MSKLISTGSIGLAGMLVTGVIAYQSSTAFALEDGSAKAALKRDDGAGQVVMTVDDDDDNDTGDDMTDGVTDDVTMGDSVMTDSSATDTGDDATTATGDPATDTGPGVTANTNTNTTAAGMDTRDSTFDDSIDTTKTMASRNKDRSRGEHVIDLTNDGPGKNNIDMSTHHTNDKSKHDTGR